MSNCPHIGSLIKQRLAVTNVHRVLITNKMNIAHTAIYAYEKRATLNTATLYNLCEAMSYNFYRDIADTLPPEYPSRASLAAPAYVNPLAATVATQAELIKKLETENALLKELFALGKKA